MCSPIVQFFLFLLFSLLSSSGHGWRIKLRERKKREQRRAKDGDWVERRQHLWRRSSRHLSVILMGATMLFGKLRPTMSALEYDNTPLEQVSWSRPALETPWTIILLVYFHTKLFKISENTHCCAHDPSLEWRTPSTALRANSFSWLKPSH